MLSEAKFHAESYRHARRIQKINLMHNILFHKNLLISEITLLKQLIFTYKRVNINFSESDSRSNYFIKIY